MGLYSPTKVAVDEEGGLTLTMMRTLLARKAEAILAQQQIETAAETIDDDGSVADEIAERDDAVQQPIEVPSGANGPLTLEQLRRAGSDGNGSGSAGG